MFETACLRPLSGVDLFLKGVERLLSEWEKVKNHYYLSRNSGWSYWFGRLIDSIYSFLWRGE